MPRTFPGKKVVETASVPTTSKIVHEVHLIDGSGSMAGGKFVNAVKGVNEDLAASSEASIQTGVGGTYSILQFSKTLSIVDGSNGNVLMHPISDVVHYAPVFMNSSTALYKSIRDVIHYYIMNKKKGEKVLLKIFTDGQDTDRGVTPATVAEMIKDAQDNHDFTITFVGTQQDVAYINKTLGIDASNSLVHDNTAEGITDAFNTTRSASIEYRKGVAEGMAVTMNFYGKSTDKD